MSPTDFRSTVTDLHGSSPRRVQMRKLLRKREQLSAAAIEHTGHDLPGAHLLWQAVHVVEEELRRQFPRLWERRNADWVTQDAARLHTVDTPQPEHCRVCARTAQVNAPRAS